MKIEGNRVTFSKKLEVKYSGNLIEETEEQITLQGADEDSYLKIYSPFRGIAQLLLFENGKWIDAESGSSQFDLSSLGIGNSAELDNIEKSSKQAEDQEKTEILVSDTEEEVELASEKAKKQKSSNKE